MSHSKIEIKHESNSQVDSLSVCRNADCAELFIFQDKWGVDIDGEEFQSAEGASIILNKVEMERLGNFLLGKATETPNANT